MKQFTLQSEGEWLDQFENRSDHDSYDEAVEAAGKLFDGGDEGDFRIVENATGQKRRLRGYTFSKQPCPVCGKESRARDMERTYDCHGIPFRKVCSKCYDRIMNERGFDGERYTEADECIDYDY